MNAADAIRHLSALTAGWPRGALMELRALQRGHPPVRTFRTVDAAAGGAWTKWVADAEAAGYDVYVGAQPRATPGGKAEDVAGYAGLVIDLDPQHIAHARAQVAALAAQGMVPSIAIGSGRPTARHFYYLLDEIAPVDAGRPVLRRLIGYVGGDQVDDPPRILRLAGTRNSKSGALARVIRADSARRYSIQTAVAALDAVGAPTPPPPNVRIRRVTSLPTMPTGTPALPNRMSRWGRFVASCRRLDMLKVRTYRSRSERDFGVCARLARVGWSSERIVQLLTTTPLALGDKTRELGAEYAWRTANAAITAAARWGAR